MFNANCYNIMIVSPSDVVDERKIIKKAIYRWNEINSKTRKIVLLVSGWDINAHPDSGTHPQTSLNQQILKEADFVIAVFWNKIGTPTEEYPSGSIEEIMRHMAEGKKAFIYFSNRPVQRHQIDEEQSKKLDSFKEKIHKVAFYKEFSTLEELTSILNDDIQLISNELESPSREANSPTTHHALSDFEKQLLALMNEKNDHSLQWVSTFGGKFINGNQIRDIRQIAEIERALKTLIQKNLIKPNRDGNIFTLTADGFEACESLGV